MASNQKEVKVKVATEEELSGVEALELRINKLKKQQLQLNINAKTEELDNANNRIEEIKRTIAGLEAVPPHLGIDIDESEINKLKTELAQLDQETLDLELSIETDELNKAKLEVEELENEEIEVQLRNQSAMEAIDQISQGFDRLKQGATEVGHQLGDILESAGKQETNKVFLEESFKRQGKSAEDAAGAIEGINNAVKDLPGNDTVMQGLLSQAVSKDLSLTDQQIQEMGTSAANYFSAMEYYGKNSTEAFQDMNNYLIAGNTAEIERSPILASHIDKLKEGTTIQERSKLLQEALNEEGWGTMANQETYNNKLETFMGMLDRGKYTLGGFFQEGAKGAMQFALDMDEATGGLVGMGLAVGQMAMPMFDVFMGLGQMATGMKAIKDLGFIKWLKDLEIANKLAKISQLELNLSFLTNPIFLVVAAIVALVLILGYLYFNNEQVRAAVDGLGQSLMQFGQWVYNGAIYWLDQLRVTLENLWNYITTLGGLLPANVDMTGNSIIDSILRVLLFLATLPLQIGMIFINIIAKALGFGDNFAQRLFNAARNAGGNFMNQITSLPGKLQTELSNMLSAVNDWAATLPQKFWDAGVNAVKNFLSALGIASPGTMQRMLIWEISEMGNRVPGESKKLLSNVSDLGSNIVDSFGDPTLGLNYEDTMNSQLETVTTGNNANGNTYNFYHYGDMDNEERMEKFVDAVYRRLHFENSTAGRTV